MRRAQWRTRDVDQDVRAMTYTRFETTERDVQRRHPEVGLYSFLPRNSQRRLLGWHIDISLAVADAHKQREDRDVVGIRRWQS